MKVVGEDFLTETSAKFGLHLVGLLLVLLKLFGLIFEHFLDPLNLIKGRVPSFQSLFSCALFLILSQFSLDTLDCRH